MKMTRSRIFAAAFGALAVAATSTAALATTAWDYLGSRQVNWLIDHDTIPVGIVQGTFDKVLLKVRGNGLFVYDLKVTYANGAVQDVPVRFHFAQGTTSRVISLAGPTNRIIRNVQITYSKPYNGNGPTYVDIFGRH
jgi:hypothetical protein